MIELYRSIQGESSFVGLPCTFVRLAGCNLRCSWCDSTYTFTGGVHRAIDDVVADAVAMGPGLIEVTGGEPLVQRQCVLLLERLVETGRTILLETSGSLDISVVPEAVHIIMDLKAPDSGESGANLLENIPLLRPKDELKLVLASRRDYEWARDLMRVHQPQDRCSVLISPVFGAVGADDLVDWMLEDALPARFQLQLHKFIWPPEARGV